MVYKLIFVLLLLGVKLMGFAQKEIAALRFAEPIRVDGVLDEQMWSTANWNESFLRQEPENGVAPSQITKFAIGYDDDNVYVAIVAHDSVPADIERRLVRRDSRDGDFVEVNFDSFNDKRTAFAFTVNAAGVKSDAIITDDGNDTDDSWNPIWYVHTSMNTEGWVAEMRIPLDQLRFNSNPVQEWGVQIGRFIFRTQEYIIWSAFSPDKSGWTQHFGRLKGIQGISPKRLIEFTPYASAGLNTFLPEAENPFLTSGKEPVWNAGLDAKLGITNDLTLDLTLNPDFGQVEADPSEVNLSGFESFFREQRPFFIEGSSITSFSLTSFGGNLSQDNLFYSRRIGKAPQFTPDVAENQFLKMPRNARILAAAKLTGKTEKGWSVGLLETVTRSASAEIATVLPDYPVSKPQYHKEVVAPWTNFLLGRLQRDLNRGNSRLGAAFTATNRFFDDSKFNFLHRSAYSGGMDALHTWKDRKYEVRASMSFSRVAGHSEAILATQRAHQRYFQRPDVPHSRLDSAATSLGGHAGEVLIIRNGSQGWHYLFQTSWRSPGFEVNDMGYMRSSDLISQLGWAGYRWAQPFSIFRSMEVNFAEWYNLNFFGERLTWGVEANIDARFKNFWGAYLGISLDGTGYSPTDLRGGPSLRQSGGLNYSASLSSDNRKRFIWSSGAWFYQGTHKQAIISNIWNSFSFRPISSARIATNISYNNDLRHLQYVNQLVAESDPSQQLRYIFATVQRETLTLEFRVDWSLTPDLSIQYFCQPFVASGRFSQFKRISQPKEHAFDKRFYLFPDNDIHFNPANNEYLVTDLDRNTYTVDNPDFNTKYFLSNLVLRWEFVPGSVLFLVWSQNRSHFEGNPSFQVANNLSSLFSEFPNNGFMAKLSYRIPI